jgi:superfamily II DNA or RNA helicase
MIAEDVYDAIKRYDNPQVLVLVEKTEHALVLQSLMPDFTLVHGDLDQTRKARLVKQGLLGDGERTMTSKDRDKVREGFESGEIKRVLATQIFSTGVSSDHCQIVAIASGSGAIISFIQSIGRGSRTCEGIGKTHAMVLLWRDTFARSYTARASKLVGAAKKQGHKIVRIPWAPR